MSKRHLFPCSQHCQKNGREAFFLGCELFFHSSCCCKMPYSTLDTERIEWRDPTFFEEELMVRRALPKIHVLASDLWVLSQRFQQKNDIFAVGRLIVLAQQMDWSEADWRTGYRLIRKLHFRFEQASTYDCFDEHLDAWTSWICVYAFFELVEAKRTDVRWAYQNSLRHLLN